MTTVLLSGRCEGSDGEEECACLSCCCGSEVCRVLSFRVVQVVSMRRMPLMFRLLCGSILKSLIFRCWESVMVSKRLHITMEER